MMGTISKRSPTANFSTLFLREARRQVKKAGIKINHLHTHRYKRLGGNTWFRVFEAGCPGPVWSGNADNSSRAKAEYLYTLVEHIEETPAEVIDSVPEHMRNLQDCSLDGDSA